MPDATEQRTVQKAIEAAEELASRPLEPIPGYELEEKIGSGGYGEVWRARAPGGLLKAVKLVYGTMDESRATAELKAMERIKEVRHPFILSTERIEISSGRLIIVSELAERSLRDLFNQCRREGAPGLDRAEMLGYMRDVADALDYMREEHSLQHLDIKPENLLLVGNHVKVADFGLTKDLADASMSIVSGLTPQYSAPEVLEGKPGRHSDQYSLAIVYHFLITGQQPFHGRTAAQLMSQHLHSAPELSPLPGPDQSVVARALSKNGKRRFDSCREFVEALSSVKERYTASSKPKIAPPVPVPEEHGPRDVRPADPKDIVLKPRPPVTMDGFEPVARPTLFIAVGGLAAHVLRLMRGRLTEGLEEREKPLAGFCYLDTDELAVGESLYDADLPNFQRDEVLAMPLKLSSAYRKKFKRLVNWISRRWLFNIPRSQKTEGIRALGRLAFVDHYNEVRTHLTNSLQRVTSDESVEKLKATTELSCERAAPRVFIVGSTSGGAASGCLIDLAYLVRNVLQDLELSDAGLCGVCLLGTPHGEARRVMCAANNLTFVRELHHFTRTKQYIGDDDVEIPGQDFTSPFADCYVVPIGDDMRPDDFASAAGEVAGYLLRSGVGPTASTFDHIRKSTATRQRKPLAVRSFAVESSSHAQPFRARTMKDIRSRLFKTRGGTRLILVGKKPKDTVLPMMESAHGKPPMLLPSKERGHLLCCEVEAVPFCDIEATLEEAEPESVGIADRLHARIDIEWE